MDEHAEMWYNGKTSGMVTTLDTVNSEQIHHPTIPVLRQCQSRDCGQVGRQRLTSYRTTEDVTAMIISGSVVGEGMTPKLREQLGEVGR